MQTTRESHRLTLHSTKGKLLTLSVNVLDIPRCHLCVATAYSHDPTSLLFYREGYGLQFPLDSTLTTPNLDIITYKTTLAETDRGTEEYRFMVIFYFVQYSLSTGLYSVHPGQGHSQIFLKKMESRAPMGIWGEARENIRKNTRN